MNERSFEPRVKEVIRVISPEALEAKLVAEGARPDQALRHEQGYLFEPWVSLQCSLFWADFLFTGWVAGPWGPSRCWLFKTWQWVLDED